MNARYANSQDFLIKLMLENGLQQVSTPGRVTRSKAREEGIQQPNHSLHINTRLVVLCGTVPEPMSGHGRPMGAGQPAPMGSRSPHDI